MKNTIRVSRNNTSGIKAPQGKKTTIHGQKASSIGPAKPDTRGKVTLGAVRIGAALGLSDDEIKSLALLAAWKGPEPLEFCKAAVLAAMQARFEEIKISVRDARTPEAKLLTERYLSQIPKAFRHVASRAKAVAPNSVALSDLCGAISELGFAVTQSNALAELMFTTLDSENAGTFHNNNGRLASGVQSLMWVSQERLTDAYDKVHAEYVRAKNS